MPRPGGRFDHYASTLGESRTDIGELDPLPCVPAAQVYPDRTQLDKGIARESARPAGDYLGSRCPDFLRKFQHLGFEGYRDAKMGLAERKIGNQRADDILAGDDNQLEAERFPDGLCPFLRGGVGDTAGGCEY